MPRAEKAKVLADSYWGSRRSRSAQDTSTVKELNYDIAHLRLHEYASKKNDAKACYDRMVPNLIMVISRSFGISRGACRSVGKTFQKTRHHLTTKNGISKESFGYSNANPIFGSWQGATKSVVNWVLTSSIIQNIHKATTEGATFQSKDGE